MAVLALPAAMPQPTNRLKLLIGLAALIAFGMAVWPEPSEPRVAVIAAQPVPGRAAVRDQSRVPEATQRLPSRVAQQADVDLFAHHSWYRPPPPPPPRVVIPPAPTAPPFPYLYLGQYERLGDKPVYFLHRGDSVFDVQVGQVLDGVWSVDAVTEGQMRLTYTPLRMQQVISAGSPP